MPPAFVLSQDQTLMFNPIHSSKLTVFYSSSLMNKCLCVFFQHVTCSLPILFRFTMFLELQDFRPYPFILTHHLGLVNTFFRVFSYFFNFFTLPSPTPCVPWGSHSIFFHQPIAEHHTLPKNKRFTAHVRIQNPILDPRIRSHITRPTLYASPFQFDSLCF